MMCGVIGFQKKSIQHSDLNLIKRLFLETEIRGKHATGISWLSDNKIHTVKLPIGAKEFLTKFDLGQVIDKDSITMIGHIRYSTSDLRYNQPFSNEQYSIVHNGVLSQEPVDKWSIKTETSNDSEMILQVLTHESIHPLEYFPDGSQATVYLNQKGVFGYRNGQRPLWYSYDNDALIFTSTENIGKRSGVNTMVKVDMNTEISVQQNQLIKKYFPTNKKDLQ